jgi:hypothetical protein
VVIPRRITLGKVERKAAVGWGWRRPGVVENGDLGGEEGAVIAVGDGQHAQRPNSSGMACNSGDPLEPAS